MTDLRVESQRPFWQRLVVRIAATRFGGWLVRNIITPLDIGLLRMSTGRIGFNLLAGTPILLLNTIGAKSGKPRSIPLQYIPNGVDYVLIASATGIKHHPAWYYNLKKHPAASILTGGKMISVTAHEVYSEERDALWQRAVEIYSGYDDYRRRASNRVIPVMILTPKHE
jgi:deazaflavin-dependent oxidoreductase (nitroreductase family)